MKRKTLLLLTLLSFSMLAGIAHAGDKWDKGELWDLFRFGKWKTVKAAVLKNPKLINQHDPSNQMTPLHGAARFGPPELVLFFIGKGADVNAVEYNRFTPLHDATTPANVKVLITHGANTEQKDAWGNTPLQKNAEAVFNRPQNTEARDLSTAMLDAGAKLDILSALYLGKRDEARKMVEADPTLLIGEHANSTSLWHNVTPLGIAAASGDKELVEFFLANKAPVDGATTMPMSGTMTPLTNALFSNHLEVAEILLKAGASLDIKLGGQLYLGMSLVQWADKQPDPKVRELIHRYADARAKQ